VSPAHLRNLVIAANRAYRGGGLFLSAAASIIEDCEIISNTADSGGGVYLLGGYDRLERNIIRANKGDWGGGGLFLNASSARLINNAIVENVVGFYKGAGVFFYGGAPHLIQTTIADNRGESGVFVDNTGFPSSSTTVAMTNTVVSGHTVGVKISSRQNNTVTLTATLWYGNGADREVGSGVINHTKDFSGAPAFAADGYHLTAASAAINKGIDAGVHKDIDGEVRPWSGGYDIGADEFGSVKPRYRYLPLTLHKR